jgi:hypothetical protein
MRGARAREGTRPTEGCKYRAAGNPEKKGIFATPENKKALAKVRACAIFRADSHRALHAHRI